MLNREQSPQETTASAQDLPTDEVATTVPTVIRPAGWQLGSAVAGPSRSGAPGRGPRQDSFRHVTCQQLLPGDRSDTSGTIVVVGSSHSRQYIPALLPTAEHGALQIVNLTMDGCRLLWRGTERTGYCTGYDEYVLLLRRLYRPRHRADHRHAHGSPRSAEETLPDGAAARRSRRCWTAGST